MVQRSCSHKKNMALIFILRLKATNRHFSSTITALANAKPITNDKSKPNPSSRVKTKSNGVNNNQKKTKPKFNTNITSNTRNTKNTSEITKFVENIKTLCKEGRLKQAVDILKDMDKQGIRADVSAYASLLQCCVESKALAEGKTVHNHMIQNDFNLDLFLGTKLVVMYIKCGSLVDARKVFDKMYKRNAVSWSAMIAAYAKGQPEKALKLFYEMQESGVEPDEFTFASVLPACARLGSLEQGNKVYKEIKRRGFEGNMFVGSALVDMYVKCGSLEDASKVFDEMPERNVVSWTAMIAGYAQNGQVGKARKLFDKMPERNIVSWNAMLAGYAQSGNFDQAEKLLEEMPEQNVASWNAMIAGYAHNGYIGEALEFFEQMPNRDIISWNTMISIYAQNWHFNEALDMYRKMQKARVKPNPTTFASVLPACANSAALQQGKGIHEDIRRSGLQSSLFVGSALLDMYAKCGSIDDARKVFDKMPERNVVSWTVMIVGYAMHGYGKEALQLFKEMQQSGAKPNHITFAGVLAACSHAGLVDDGREYFDSMSRDHNIGPELGHYCCIVDLLGRAGLLDEAKDFIKKMPMEPDIDIWVSLLGACRVHNNLRLGKRVAEHLLKIDPHNFSHYVMILNMYAEAGRLDEKEKIRKLMIERQIKKAPGRSWIEINNKILSFSTGDRSHLQTAEILSKLQQLSEQMKEAGYVSVTDPVLHDAEDNEEHFIYNHSEKMAIAFGLLHTPPGMPIQIVKNVRVCDDCHSATKIISKIVERQIFVRDAKRIHYFKDGQCSCGDYW